MRRIWQRVAGEPGEPQEAQAPVIPSCPYCGHEFEKAPKRRKKCPACAEYVYVRTKQQLFPSAFLTEKDARAADWAREAGIGPEEFTKKRDQLSRQFGHEASSRDVIWALLNERGSYYNMALFLNEEGRDCWHVLEQVHRNSLIRYKGYVDRVEILSGMGCDSCQALHLKRFTIEEALRSMPLPNTECTHTFRDGGKPFCRCTYTAVVEFDD